MNSQLEDVSKAEILVVDDTPDIVRLLSTLLTKQGYRVRKAINGQMALKSVQATLPDLILLDVQMPPGLNGYEVCEQLKANPQTAKIPVIFISALDEVRNQVKGFQVGGVDYITKPFQEEEVLVRVQNHLTLQQQKQKLQQQNDQLQRESQRRRLREMEIRLLLVTTQAISRSRSLDEALKVILRLLCQTIRAEIGEAWLPNEAETGLEANASSYISHHRYLSFQEQTQTLTCEKDQGIPGRIWSSQQPLWFDDVSDPQQEGCLRSPIAQELGLQGAFGVPILVHDEILAVLVFFQQSKGSGQPRWLELVQSVATQVGLLIQRRQAEEALRRQQQQTERLLLNVLPYPIAQRLKQGQNLIADQFEDASVLFADLVGFTAFSARKAPSELVELLNGIFSKFDQLAQHYDLEKIKTIGDAYMLVGGLPIPRSDHIQAIATMALDMQSTLEQFNQEMEQDFHLRIGIHMGPVVAGVIGLSKFIYDLWGDTVNIASRMESTGAPGKIQVTEFTYEQLKEQFILEARGIVEVKGKGEMMTYWLISKK